MDSGKGNEEEYGTDGRIGGCWRAVQHRRGAAEIRCQNKDRIGAELSAGPYERQAEVKVDALQGQDKMQCREKGGRRVSKRKVIGTAGRTATQGE